MARESHEKLDATAPAFSPSVVQLPQRRSGTDVQSQGETAPSAGGTTEVRLYVVSSGRLLHSAVG